MSTVFLNIVIGKAYSILHSMFELLTLPLMYNAVLVDMFTMHDIIIIMLLSLNISMTLLCIEESLI